MTARVVPADVYLDTSVFVAAMIAGDPRSPACTQLCADLAANGSAVYFSELVRQRWMQFGMAQLDALLATFQITYELPLRKRIQRQSVLLMSLYNLNSYDAVHVATALRNGVPDLATVDGDFARVSGLRVHIVR